MGSDKVAAWMNGDDVATSDVATANAWKLRGLVFEPLVRLSDYKALEAKLREAAKLIPLWRDDGSPYMADCADELAAILGDDHA